MAYPTIPLEGYWNNPQTNTPVFTRLELGKGGVIKRERSQLINNVRKEYSVTANVKDHDTLDDFLRTRNGLPFVYLSNNYTCVSWAWKWIVWVTEVGGVWELSGTFVEDFNPG